MNFDKLNQTINDVGNKLNDQFFTAKSFGDYKYWSGLHEARKILLESNGNN